MILQFIKDAFLVIVITLPFFAVAVLVREWRRIKRFEKKWREMVRKSQEDLSRFK